MAVASLIKPEVLDWVIEESGYDPAELAKKIGVANDDLFGWAAGESVAPKGKVSALLRMLKRSPDIVYLDSVPEEARLKAHFRTMKVAGPPVSLSPEEIQAIREAMYVQQFISNVLQIDESDPVRVADELRLSSQLPVASQSAHLRSWIESDGTSAFGRSFPEWRRLVEARSIFVMTINIRRPRGWQDSNVGDPSKLRGFSLADEFAPLIVVCTDYPPAKTFTLFHELAHLGLKDGVPGSCHVPVPSSDATERWCDRVAGAALVPKKALRAFVGGNQMAEPDMLVDRVSRKFAVSKRAAAVAIEDGLGVRGVYRRTHARLPFRDRNPKSNTAGGPGFNRVELRLQKFGEGLMRSVLQHFAKGTVTEAQARRVFDLGGDELYEAAHRLGVDIPV